MDIFLYFILFFSGYMLYRKYFGKISIDKACKLIRLKLNDTLIVRIQTFIPNKYYDDYWINVILMNIINKDDYKVEDLPSVNIRELTQQQDSMPKRISLREVKKYIKNVLKEDKIIKSGAWKAFYNPCSERELKEMDEPVEIELKTISEINNDLPGTVLPNDPKMNEKLKIIDRENFNGKTVEVYPKDIQAKVGETISLDLSVDDYNTVEMTKSPATFGTHTKKIRKKKKKTIKKYKKDK